jgi:uncharacterized protein YegJ (DUF2314 family)
VTTPPNHASQRIPMFIETPGFRVPLSRGFSSACAFHRSCKPRLSLKRITPIVPVLVAVLASLFAGCAHREKGYVEDTDPEMAAAIARAQKTLPHFWRTFDLRPHGESNFVLVVRITDKGRIEHFHTTDFERREGKTVVTISHSPKIVGSVKLGERIEIPEADITDWHYMRDGKYVGMFTMKPRFKLMPPEQVEAFKRVMTDP